jgi:hypothetical protein
MDLRAALADIWRATVSFVPKAVGFIAILLIGFLVARLIRRGVKQLLGRFGFDDAVRRGGITRFLSGSRYQASDIVAMLAYYTVLLFTLQLAFGIWGPNPVSDLIAAVVAWLPSAIIAIVILVVAAALASAVKNVIASMLSSLSYGRLLANLAAVFIVGLGVIAALNQIGIATTVTTPVLITVLATIGGILVVGVGGGLIRPMQQRWERWLSKAEDESGAVRETVRAYAATRREAMEAEAAARRERENAPAVGMQPMGTTFVPGKASVGAAPTAPIYPPAQVRSDAPPAPVRSDAPTVPEPPNPRQGWPVWGGPDRADAADPADNAVDNAADNAAVDKQADRAAADRPTDQAPFDGQPPSPAAQATAPEHRAAQPTQPEHQGAQPEHQGAQPEDPAAQPMRPESRTQKAAQPERARKGRPDGRAGQAPAGASGKARPDSPVRPGAPVPRSDGDAPTQILRPVDPGDRADHRR